MLPIINDGDVNWTGAVELHLTNQVATETVVLNDVAVEASTSQVVTLAPTMTLAEGLLNWSVVLTNVSTSQTGTHTLNGSWDVGPPPLPMLEDVDTNADEVQAGDDLTVWVTVWNNGTVSFTGSISCVAGGIEVFNTSSIGLNAASNASWSFTLSAKPMILECDAGGARISDASTTPFQSTVEMPSAVFQSAGTTTPTYNGGPWHKGDHVEANLLLRNIGDVDGRVRLVLSSGTSTAQGDWVEMEQGAAGEISASLQFLEVGETQLTWTLESDNGVVDGLDQGLTTFVIKQQQSVQLSFAEVSRTENADIDLTLHIDLDEGKDREIRLQVGYEAGGSTIFLQENDLQLQQGLMELSMVFGDIPADRLIAQISPIDWLIGPGPLAVTASLPGDETQFWLAFSRYNRPDSTD